MEVSGVRRVKTRDGKFLMVPKNDYAFKKIFGTEANKDLLIALLNAIIYLPSDEIDSIEFIDKELKGDYYDERAGILDIGCKTKHGTYINVEMQLIDNRNMDKRSLFYWSKIYIGQMKSGEVFNKLKKTITISILDFEYLKDINKMHSIFHVVEDETKKMLTDVFELHFIEIPKLYKMYEAIGLLNEKEEELKEWIEFIGSEDEEVLEMLAKNNEKINKAYKVLTTISQDEVERRLYEAREMQIHDEVSRLQDAIEEGKQEGKQQGIKEGIKEGIGIGDNKRAIEDAINLLKLGISEEIVSQGIGLPLEKVHELKNQMKN